LKSVNIAVEVGGLAAKPRPPKANGAWGGNVAVEVGGLAAKPRPPKANGAWGGNGALGHALGGVATS